MTSTPGAPYDENALFSLFVKNFEQGQRDTRLELKSITKHVASIDRRLVRVEESISSDKSEHLASSMDALTKQLKSSKVSQSSILPRTIGDNWIASIDWVKFFKGLAVFIIILIAFILGINLETFLKL
jgi:hypothetical protein